jgi:hypothetical protein
VLNMGASMAMSAFDVHLSAQLITLPYRKLIISRTTYLVSNFYTDSKLYNGVNIINNLYALHPVAS